jgi:hypothetical protein
VYQSVPAVDYITVELPGELLLEKVMAGITIKRQLFLIVFSG